MWWHMVLAIQQLPTPHIFLAYRIPIMVDSQAMVGRLGPSDLWGVSFKCSDLSFLLAFVIRPLHSMAIAFHFAVTGLGTGTQNNSSRSDIRGRLLRDF